MASSDGGGGGVRFFKQELGRGYNFYLKIFLGDPVLKHYTNTEEFKFKRHFQVPFHYLITLSRGRFWYCSEVSGNGTHF